MEQPVEIAKVDELKEAAVAPPLSKNQLKKQRKLAEYEQKKKERRIRERERQKLKLKRLKAEGLPTRTGPSRKELKKRSALPTAAGKLTVAIDLDYDTLMSDKDVAKCVKQCLRMYTINRRSACPGHLHLTGIKTDGNIHGSFKRNDGWENWQVNYHFDKTHTEVFPPEKLIYLTCESDNVLQQLEEDKVYVIGGLVDHNHLVGLCHQRATEAKLKTARLPLSEYVDMKTRSVLSTFHVFEILVRISEGKSWTEAILETIPSRKGAKAKDDAMDVSVSEKDLTDEEVEDEPLEGPTTTESSNTIEDPASSVVVAQPPNTDE